MVLSAREIALNILIDISQNGAFSNITLNKHLQDGLDNREEALVREIVYGVLENQMYID